MSQEDNDLLLRDLSGRLPYWVICDIGGGKEHTLLSIHISRITEILCEFHDMEDTYQVPLANVKPYLRPMSSMTEEEQKILEDFGVTISPFSGQMHIPFDEIEFPFITMQKIISYLYSIHIDINGLIPKGLAIEVTEDNNIYKR